MRGRVPSRRLWGCIRRASRQLSKLPSDNLRVTHQKVLEGGDTGSKDGQGKPGGTAGRSAPEPACGLKRNPHRRGVRSPDTGRAHRPGSQLAVSCGPARNLEPELRRNWTEGGSVGEPAGRCDVRAR